MSAWSVWKKKGARRSPWRVVLRGTEQEAKERYAREHARLDAGHLVLGDGEGRLVCHQWAGRLYARRTGPRAMK